jgi:hypothetical protein
MTMQMHVFKVATDMQGNGSYLMRAKKLKSAERIYARLIAEPFLLDLIGMTAKTALKMSLSIFKNITAPIAIRNNFTWFCRAPNS